MTAILPPWLESAAVRGCSKYGTEAAFVGKGEKSPQATFGAAVLFPGLS